MSIISSILLFLLCLPFHACNARRLAANGGEEPEKKVHLSSKNDHEKVSPIEISIPPKAKPEFSNKIGAGNTGDSMPAKETSFDEDDHKPISSKQEDKEKLNEQGAKISGHLQRESLVSVPWRVPHNKQGEKQPGFNSDYSPPKTHPPVHN